MIFFSLIVAAYVLLLVLIKPAPSSLKAAPKGWLDHVVSIKVSLLLGVAVLTIFLLVSNFSFDTVDNATYAGLALNNLPELAMLWPLQVLTHSFGHINALHVMANVSGLGLLSCYERRVGARRYLAVFAIACASAMLALFFYPVPTAISGISGGLYGLAAAYFTDNAELALKDWLSFIAMFLVLAILLAWGSEVQMSKDSAANFRIDHIGHAFGALGAIAYCQIKPAACL